MRIKLINGSLEGVELLEIVHVADHYEVRDGCQRVFFIGDIKQITDDPTDDPEVLRGLHAQIALEQQANLACKQLIEKLEKERDDQRRVETELRNDLNGTSKALTAALSANDALRRELHTAKPAITKQQLAEGEAFTRRFDIQVEVKLVPKTQ